MNIRSTWKCFGYSIAVCLLISSFFVLGVWQLNRAHWKQELITRLQAKTQQSPLNLNIDNFNNKFNVEKFSPVVATGYWLSNNYFLLDNQIVNKQVGFRVIMPFVLSDVEMLDEFISEDLSMADKAKVKAKVKNKTKIETSSIVLLVDRGFVPCKNRKILPRIDTKTGTLAIRGIVYQQPTGMVLGKDVNLDVPMSSDGIKAIVIQNINFLALKQKLFDNHNNQWLENKNGNAKLLEFVVRLNKDDNSALEQTEISFGIPVAKHIGYAIQWFSLCLLSMGYGVILWKRCKDRIYECN